MTMKLDASHKCIIKNWEAIDRMNACREQVDGYVREIAKRAFHGLKPKWQEHFQEDDGLARGAWIQLKPKAILQVKESSKYHFVIGIEEIKGQTILHPSADYFCKAYVYSVYGSDKNRQMLINNALHKTAKAPGGFVLGDLNAGGYVFEKQLPSLTCEEFEDPQPLESYFVEPMLVLIEWWKTNENVILDALLKTTSS